MAEDAQCLNCPHDLCIRRVPMFFALENEALREPAPRIRHREFFRGDGS